jgi:trehalose 6-phosphate synthase
VRIVTTEERMHRFDTGTATVSEPSRDVSVARWPVAPPPLVRRARRDPAPESAQVDLDASPVWTAARLGEYFHATFPGARLAVVANRAPVVHEQHLDGSVAARKPASGVVTALEPLALACNGVWIAHGNGTADRSVVDDRSGLAINGPDGRYRLRRVWLTDDDEQGYYYGFANSALWPLCHLAHVKPVFRPDDLHRYWHVNGQFTEALAEEAGDAPVVLLQDYHFALAPRMIRDRLPHATTVTFWHIPWPNRHRFAICPWRKELLHGLLGSSVLGLQTMTDCHNFLEAVQQCLEAHVDYETHAVTYEGRRVLVRPYPISIEWPIHRLDRLPGVEACRRAMRRRLGLGEEALVTVGVDRLDYTKGLEEKFAGVEQLLDHHRDMRGRFVLVQVAAPTRGHLDRYRDEAEYARAAAARVNERFGTAEYRPIVLIEEFWTPDDVFALYRAADACAVTSLHDGMNLVSKEFVAARTDGAGALVLSEFTGAARELRDAILVNPYNAREVGAALHQAVSMPLPEQRERMAEMRAVVSRDNAYRWAARMLRDAADVRQEERRAGR